jgi:kinetochore protein NDC80
MTFRAAELREELHSEMERILKYVVDFKLHVQVSLENYEEFVAKEEEKELREREEEFRERWAEKQNGEEDGETDVDGDISMDD